MNLEILHSNENVKTIMSLFLVLYASLARPDLPNFIRKLFENPIFRILVLSLIVYRGNKDPQLSLMVAIAFTVTLNLMAEKEVQEGFKQIEAFRNQRKN
jgi:hypothetical protein